MANKAHESSSHTTKSLSEKDITGTLNANKIRKPRGNRWKNKKKLKEKQPQCIGYFVDALDNKMFWAQSKILAYNPETKRLKITFSGFDKRHDIWTDIYSIAPHGKHVPLSRGLFTRSWSGDVNLFDDVYGELGTYNPQRPSHIPVQTDTSKFGPIIPKEESRPLPEEPKIIKKINVDEPKEKAKDMIKARTTRTERSNAILKTYHENRKREYKRKDLSTSIPMKRKRVKERSLNLLDSTFKTVQSNSNTIETQHAEKTILLNTIEGIWERQYARLSQQYPTWREKYAAHANTNAL